MGLKNPFFKFKIKNRDYNVKFVVVFLILIMALTYILLDYIYI